jgi:hypothetical protein
MRLYEAWTDFNSLTPAFKAKLAPEIFLFRNLLARGAIFFGNLSPVGASYGRVIVKNTKKYEQFMKKTLTVKTISSVFALGIVCVIGHSQSSQAQGTLNVNATISGVQNGGVYDYTIILNNPASSSAVETFWFDWTPGNFYLESNPTSTGEPAGWSVSLTSGSIEYNTSTAPLEPGFSDTFTFVSTEAPASVYADSDKGAADSSTVYTGPAAFSGSAQTFNVAAVPEPSSISLIAIGLAGAVIARKRHFSL